jgi:transposase InsO family protein
MPRSDSGKKRKLRRQRRQAAESSETKTKLVFEDQEDIEGPDGDDPQDLTYSDQEFESAEDSPVKMAEDMVKVLLKELRAEREQHQKDMGRLMDLVAQSRDLQGQGQGQQSARSTLGKQVKPPEPLSSTATYSDFQVWRQSWEDYALLQQLDKATPDEKRAALRVSLSDGVKRLVKNKAIEGVDDNSEIAAILQGIDLYIKKRENPWLNYQRFEARKQKHGELFDDFYLALCDLARTADLCKHCYDQRIVARIQAGLDDRDIAQRLSEQEEFPTLEKALDFCRKAESAKRSDVKSNTTAMNKVATKFQKSQVPKGRSNESPCGQCGKKHPDGKCPAKNAECRKCKKTGHFACMCRSKEPAQKKPAAKTVKVRKTEVDREDSKKVKVQSRVVQVERAAAQLKSPQISVKVKSTKGAKSSGISMLATPDTGAEITIMSEAQFKELKVPRKTLREANVEAINADGQAMKLKGMFTAKITYGERSTEATVYISQEVEGFLLDWQVCQKLAVIPKDYPAQIKPKIGKIEKKFSITVTENPSQAEIARVKDALLKEFAQVFQSDEGLKAMNVGEPMKIHLRKEYTPFALTGARPVPYALREKVLEELKTMEKNGIIEKIGDRPTEWCHPLVVVRKPCGGVRICVDFTKLNKFCDRPYYPLMTPKEAVDNVKPANKFFTTMDATKGYWQVELDEESQDLTTFICSEGRFRFKRAPMGLVSTGDEYCRRGDVALSGIKDIEKVVDDLLVHSDTFQSHVNTCIEVLERCREHQITLHPKKFKFAEPNVEFVGFRVSKEGIEADPAKVKAIAEFPRPTNITELRSFFGLVNQLGQFSKDVAAAAEPLRALLKKENLFQWSENHTEAFEAVKKTLISPPILAPFDPKLPVILETDASRLKGLGYLLLQRDDNGQKKLIQCGSRFVSDTESRYAMVELELLAVTWAIKKCKMYLMGLPHFMLIIDHNPLVPILNEKTMDHIENPRIMRMKEKLLSYTFTAEWRKGKEHAMADALSRAPVEDPSKEDISEQGDLSQLMVAHVREITLIDKEGRQQDLQLESLIASAQIDEEYETLRRAVSSGFGDKKAVPAHLLPYYKLRQDLSVEGDLVLYGTRIVIPREGRREVLRRLHDSHQGIERTKRRARQAVFWPGITADIVNTVGSCVKCQERKPSLPAEQEESDPPPSYPFEEVGADFFEHAGKHFLAYVDRYSGWPEVISFGHHAPTSKTLKSKLRKIFSQTGVPRKFRSDGGTQFTSEELREFFRNWNILHVLSAPHYPQSNGLAESAVKSMKHLVATSTENGNIDIDEFHKGLLEFRNTPRNDGSSPAETLYGKPMRSCLPAYAKLFKRKWKKLSKQQEEIDATKMPSRPEKGKELRPLEVGQEVWIQDHRSHRWTMMGTVTERQGRNYTVKLPSGRVYWRNRRHIRPRVDSGESRGQPTKQPKPDAPRRGSRNRKQTDFYR